MEKAFGDLSSALGLGPREHLALVGGGGKTTVMFALAGELCKKGKKVVTTTTTKIWVREGNQAPGTIFLTSGLGWEGLVRTGLCDHGHVFVGREILSTGKVAGISKPVADALFGSSRVDYLIVEADGAAGRPVKAPASHEPLIPDSATVVIAVMGLDALWARFDETNVFRADRFEKITGVRPGEKMTPETLARLFSSPEGLFKGAPDRSRRIAFLNKADVLENDREARFLAKHISSIPRTSG